MMAVFAVKYFCCILDSDITILIILKTLTMKKFLRFSVLCLMGISVLVLDGCKKNDGENGPDTGSLLTAHTWKFATLTTTSSDVTVQAAVAMIAAFLTNATATFSNDGTYSMTILGSSGGGTWEMSEDGSTLTLDKGTEDEAAYTISTLTSDVLMYGVSVEDADLGMTYDMNFKWVKP